MPDVEQIARSLTKAQRERIVQLGNQTPSYQRTRLEHLGIVCRGVGPLGGGTQKLTPLGLSVRDFLLKDKQDVQ